MGGKGSLYRTSLPLISVDTTDMFNKIGIIVEFYPNCMFAQKLRVNKNTAGESKRNIINWRTNVRRSFLLVSPTCVQTRDKGAFNRRRISDDSKDDSSRHGDESVKKSPLNSPFFSRVSDWFAYLRELGERNLTYSDLCKMLCKERGVDEELFNKVIAANPAVSEISSFVNPLLMEAYDDTPRKISWCTLIGKCMWVAYKAPTLLRKFYKDFTVPEEVLKDQAKAKNGEDRIRTCGTHTGSRI